MEYLFIYRKKKKAIKNFHFSTTFHKTVDFSNGRPGSRAAHTIFPARLKKEDVVQEK